MAFVVLMEYTALYCPQPHAVLHESPFFVFLYNRCAFEDSKFVAALCPRLFWRVSKVVCLPPILPG